MIREGLECVVIIATLLVGACGDNFDRDVLLGTSSSDAMPLSDGMMPDEGSVEESYPDGALPDEVDFTNNTDETQGTESEMPDTTMPDNAVPDDGVSSPRCGNGIVESGETCDGGNISCETLLGSTYTGNAGCRTDCAGWDTSSCQQVASHPVYAVDPAKCTGCRRCLPACSVSAISIVSYKAVIDPEKCIGCGTCASWCPRGAIYKKQ